MKGKAFIFMGVSTEGFFLSVKLPQSNGAALMLPFAQPTGYGMAKSGWVSANFGAKDTPPMDILRHVARRELSRRGPQEARGAAGRRGGGTEGGEGGGRARQGSERPRPEVRTGRRQEGSREEGRRQEGSRENGGEEDRGQRALPARLRLETGFTCSRLQVM